MYRWIERISLQGVNVRLEPLEMEHAQALSAATKDGKLWELWYTNVPAPDDMGEYIEKALLMREENGAPRSAIPGTQGAPNARQLIPNANCYYCSMRSNAWARLPSNFAHIGTIILRARRLLGSLHF